MNVYNSALVPLALERPPHQEDFPWCDKCFPILSEGLRVDFAYMEQVTGLTRSQLEVMRREVNGDDS